MDIMEFSGLTVGLAGAFLGALVLWLFAWRNDSKGGNGTVSESVKAQIESLKSQIGSLEHERTTLLGRLSSAEIGGGEPNPLEAELTSVRRALEAAQNELANAKQGSVAALASPDEHQSQIRALMDQLSEAHGLAAAAQQSLSEKEAWVSTQKSQWLDAAKVKWLEERSAEDLAEAEARFTPLLTAANQEVESIKSRLTELESANIRLQSERSELEGQVQNLRSAKQESDAEISTLTSAMRAAEETLARTETESREHDALIQTLRREKLEAETKIMALTNASRESEVAMERIAELEAQLQLARQEATVSAQSAENSHRARVGELEDTVQMLREVNSSRVDPLEVEAMRREFEEQLARAQQSSESMVPKSELEALRSELARELDAAKAEAAQRVAPDELAALRAGFEKERQALLLQKESALAKFDGFVDPKEVEAMRLTWEREKESLTNQLSATQAQEPNRDAEEELARLKADHAALQNQFREQEHRFVANRDQSDRITELEAEVAALKSAPADHERQTLRALQTALSERDSANARLADLEAERSQLQRLLVLAREVSDENDALKAKLAGQPNPPLGADAEAIAALESQLRIAQNEASAARAMVSDMSEELTRLREGSAPDPRRFGGELG